MLFSQTDSLRISWDPNTEADMLEYRLYRSVSSPQNFQLLGSISHPQTNTVDRNGIQPGGYYFFTLTAVDSAGNQSDFSDTVAVGLPVIDWTVPQISTGDTTMVPLHAAVNDPNDNPADLILNLSNPNHLTVQQSGNYLVLRPEPLTYTGSAGFTLRVEDPAGFWDIDNISLNVAVIPVNHPPQITSSPLTTATAGTAYQYQVTATDPDTGDVLTYLLPTKPAFLNINSGTGLISGTPAINDTGTHPVTVRVRDQAGATANQNYTLTVSWQNEPPVITAIPDQIVAEGTAFPPLSLDNYVQDPDHQDRQLIWTYNGNSALTVTIDTARVARVAVPNQNWNGEEAIIFTVTDPGGLFDRDTVIYRVTPVNDAPRITSVPLTLAVVDSLYRYPVVATDPDAGDVLTFSLPTAPGFLSINSSSGVVTGTPTTSDTGSYPVTVRVRDQAGATANQNYTLTVSWQNEPPVITSIPDQIVAEGTAFPPLSLDNYVQDPDHQDRQLIWTYNGNSALTVTIDTARVARVAVPDQNWNGEEAIIFTVTDPGGLSDRDTVIYRVTPVNDAPLVQLTELVLDNGDSKVFDLKPYASDVENTPLQLQWNFVGYQNFDFTWENSAQKLIRITKIGNVSLESGQFVVTDIGGLSDTANVRIIAPDGTTNTPPSLAYLPSVINIDEDSNTLIRLDQFVVDSTNAFTDLDWEFTPGNFIEYTYDAVQASLVIFAEPDWNGQSDFRIKVNDPQGLSDERMLNIVVNPRVDLRRIAFNTSSPGQVQVVVETDQGSQVEMSFWVNPSLKSTYKSINFLNSHRFSLQNLTPDTTYRYVLTLSDTSGYTHTYGDSTFSTGLNQLAEEDGSDIFVYPNPFRPSRGHVVVVFDNLPQQMKELLVLTTSGEVVFDKVVEGIPTRRLPWTVINKNGEQLASGLYLYVVKGENGKKLKAGKLAVIR
jgi:hypothetical protein